MENKDFYKKIYVIIQGPVLSKGRNFKTSIQILTKEFNSDEELVVTFNSSQTIIENSEQLIKKGINVIYSGWEKECPETLKQKLIKKGVTVILSDPNKAPSSLKESGSFRHSLKKGNPILMDNRIKQYFSLLEGLNSISDELSKTIIIKIRSDISLNFDRLIEELKNKQTIIENNAIIVQHFSTPPVSSFYRKNIRGVPDFWFVGKGNVLKKIFQDLCYRSINNKEHSHSPHTAITIGIVNFFYPELTNNELSKIRREERSIKISEFINNFSLKYEYFKKIIIRVNCYLEYFKIAVKINKLFDKLIRKNLIRSCSKKVEYSIIWRGDLQKKYINNKKYKRLFTNKQFIE